MASGRAGGFVLAGGGSVRMGRNKALLPYRGATLVEYVASQVAEVAGSVTIVGPPEPFRSLPLRALPDRYPGCGPCGGIATALLASEHQLNMIAACDMPDITAAFVATLLAAAESAPHADATVPRDAEGRIHPVCAVYRLSALAPLQRCLRGGIHKMREVLQALRIEWFAVDDPAPLRNANTPADWERP